MDKPNIPTNKEFQKQRHLNLLKYNKTSERLLSKRQSIAEVGTL